MTLYNNMIPILLFYLGNENVLCSFLYIGLYNIQHLVYDTISALTKVVFGVVEHMIENKLERFAYKLFSRRDDLSIANTLINCKGMCLQASFKMHLNNMYSPL